MADISIPMFSKIFEYNLRYLKAHKEWILGQIAPLVERRNREKPSRPPWGLILPKWPIVNENFISILVDHIVQETPVASKVYYVSPPIRKVWEKEKEVVGLSELYLSKFNEIQGEIVSIFYLGPIDALANIVVIGSELIIFEDISILKVYKSQLIYGSLKGVEGIGAIDWRKVCRDMDQLQKMKSLYCEVPNYFGTSITHKEFLIDLYNSLLLPERIPFSSKELFIYGAGNLASIFQEAIYHHANILGFIDQEPDRKRDWKPLAKIYSPKILQNFPSALVLVLASSAEEVIRELNIKYPRKENGAYIAMLSDSGTGYAFDQYLHFRDLKSCQIVLCTPGKVASSSVRSTLREAGVTVIHIHSFSEEQEKISDNILSNFYGSVNKRFASEYQSIIYTADNFRKGLKNFDYRKRKLKIISGIREPIGWLFSMIIERSYWLGFYSEKGGSPSLNSMQKILDEWDLNPQSPSAFIVNYLIDIYSNWLERELEKLTGQKIYVSANPFQIISGDSFELLIYRFEDLHTKKMTPISQFVGIKDIELQQIHETNKKPGLSWYPKELNNLNLPIIKLQNLYELDIVNSFYTKQEIAEFKNKWGI